jgi:hypothetical protein
MLAAGIASFAALPLLLSLPHSLADPAQGQAPRGLGAWFWPASAIGAFSWFCMSHVMAQAPLAFIGCGLGAAAVGGLVSWHLVAMYGPMALAARLRIFPTALTTGLGTGLLCLAFLAPRTQALAIEAGMILAGIGWSLAQIGVSQLLYDSQERSRAALALHDGIILGAALLGVLSAGIREIM